MDITFEHAKKKSKCSECEESIQSGELCVRVKITSSRASWCISCAWQFCRNLQKLIIDKYWDKTAAQK